MWDECLHVSRKSEFVGDASLSDGCGASSVADLSRFELAKKVTKSVAIPRAFPQIGLKEQRKRAKLKIEDGKGCDAQAFAGHFGRSGRLSLGSRRTNRTVRMFARNNTPHFRVSGIPADFVRFLSSGECFAYGGAA